MISVLKVWLREAVFVWHLFLTCLYFQSFFKKNHSTLIVFIINHKPELCVSEYVSECVQVCVCALVCISVYVSNFIEQPLLF